MRTAAGKAAGRGGGHSHVRGQSHCWSHDGGPDPAATPHRRLGRSLVTPAPGPCSLRRTAPRTGLQSPAAPLRPGQVTVLGPSRHSGPQMGPGTSLPNDTPASPSGRNGAGDRGEGLAWLRQQDGLRTSERGWSSACMELLGVPGCLPHACHVSWARIPPAHHHLPRGGSGQE